MAKLRDDGGKFAGRTDRVLGSQPELGVGKGTKSASSGSINPRKAGAVAAGKQAMADRKEAARQQMKAQMLTDRLF